MYIFFFIPGGNYCTRYDYYLSLFVFGYCFHVMRLTSQHCSIMISLEGGAGGAVRMDVIEETRRIDRCFLLVPVQGIQL